MQLSAKDAWKRILDEAHRELPDHTIRTWLEPTEAIALDEGRLIVGAPDQFAVEWNETKHAASALEAGRAGRRSADVDRVPGPRGSSEASPDGLLRRAPAPSSGRRRVTPARPDADGQSEQPAAQRALHLRHLRHRQVQRARRRGRPRRRRVPRQDLQPALHLRRHRARQDPPDAGDRPHRSSGASRRPGCSTSGPSSSSTRSSRASTAGPCPSSGAATAATWTSSWWTTCISSKARR